MNVTESISKIKELVGQLEDASYKVDVKLPDTAHPNVVTALKNKIAKCAEISEAILDEAQELTLFFAVKDESDKTPAPQVTNEA